MVHAAVRLRGRLQGVRGVCRVAGDEGFELGAGSLHLKRPCSLAPENQSWTIGYDGHLALLVEPRHSVPQHCKHADASVSKLSLAVPRQKALVLGKAWRKGRKASRSATGIEGAAHRPYSLMP